MLHTETSEKVFQAADLMSFKAVMHEVYYRNDEDLQQWWRGLPFEQKLDFISALQYVSSGKSPESPVFSPKEAPALLERIQNFEANAIQLANQTLSRYFTNERQLRSFLEGLYSRKRDLLVLGLKFLSQDSEKGSLAQSILDRIVGHIDGSEVQKDQDSREGSLGIVDGLDHYIQMGDDELEKALLEELTPDGLQRFFLILNTLCSMNSDLASDISEMAKILLERSERIIKSGKQLVKDSN